MENRIEEFLGSEFYDALTDAQKVSAEFSINCFVNYMSDYEGAGMSDWDSQNVTSVCLEWIPKKVTAEIEFFEHFSDVLTQFFKFLEKGNDIKNAKKIQKTIAEIKDDIPAMARDPRNWGIAKSMMMGAKQSGYDINNKEDLNHYLLDYNQNALSEVLKSKPKENPYKKIGRNDKISVKYLDGTLKENIKFKVVEQDLLNELCELIKQ